MGYRELASNVGEDRTLFVGYEPADCGRCKVALWGMSLQVTETGRCAAGNEV